MRALRKGQVSSFYYGQSQGEVCLINRVLREYHRLRSPFATVPYEACAKRKAIPRPIPCAAPVINATLVFKSLDILRRLKYGLHVAPLIISTHASPQIK